MVYALLPIVICGSHDVVTDKDEWKSKNYTTIQRMPDI